MGKREAQVVVDEPSDVPRHPGALSSRPLVSVVIPAFNHARFIVETLNSVRDEGYAPLEVIVLDDGSTDETARLAADWLGSTRIERARFERQANVGVTTTLNRLLDMATGEYIVPIASDDRLLPGGISKRIKFLSSRPELSAVFGDCRVVDVNGHVIAERGVGGGDRRIRGRMLRDPAGTIVSSWSVPGPVLLYQRRAVEIAGYYGDGLYAEDWEFYLRLASAGQIAFLDEIVADYRWHGSNTASLPDLAVRFADEFRGVAWRSRKLFRGHLYLELVHESASWAARAGWLRRRWLSWAAWKTASVLLKLIAMAVPRRSWDQRALGRVSQ
jgi:glycosyltransferase involved in cell wall biosynthesis